jgi:hypothetical protein
VVIQKLMKVLNSLNFLLADQPPSEHGLRLVELGPSRDVADVAEQAVEIAKTEEYAVR